MRAGAYYYYLQTRSEQPTPAGKAGTIMEIDEFAPLPVTDSHIHYPHPAQMPALMQICDALRIERLNIVCTPDQARLSLVPDALLLKAHYPRRVYVFGGLDISAYFRDPAHVGELFAAWIDLLRAAGCDGVKMIEGKPDMRKMLPVPPFDSPAFAPYWQKMASSGMPLVFHVNDPAEFWDAATIPDWARQQGWFYGDGSFVNNEAQYTEIFNVLKHNPGLKVVFAHFFFLSAQLERLAGLLDQFPGMCIDLTPGIEMYANFAGNIEATQAFFLKYQERILFGTDIGARALLGGDLADIQLAESRERVFLVRNFLENPGEFRLHPGDGFLFGNPEKPFRGLGLPVDVLEKIYHRNFERLVAPAPRALNTGVVVGLCHQIEATLQAMGSSQPGVAGDPSVVRQARAYFESHG
jgi:predicted TIM-barrel fold metal-dependent hydrolase